LLTYPHPLDYAAGIKYTLTDYKVNRVYTLTPETFHVEEIVDLEKMGYSTERGEYAVVRLVKENLETLKAIEMLAENLGIPAENLYFFGLKDKSARSVLYVFIRKAILDFSKLPFETENLRAEFKGFVRVKPSLSHHVGNRFTIIVRDIDERQVSVFKDIVRLIVTHGLPSYYGYQRFGVRRCNSHLLGKYTLLRREDIFANELLSKIYLYEDRAVTFKRLVKNYHGLRYESLYLKLFATSTRDSHYARYFNLLRGAYSSYLFNLLLNSVIERSGWSSLDRDYPLVGCLDRAAEFYSKILETECLELSELKSTPCYYRRGLFKPINSSVKFSSGTLQYEFQLERGMYATIVLREIFKENLVVD
jgi:tRNA pseudouridine13 synthase